MPKNFTLICFAIFILTSGCITTNRVSSQEEFFQFYRSLPHFKAYATTNQDLASNQKWAAGYADDKSSSQEAAELAMEYCEQSRQKYAIEKDQKCVISHLGEKEILYQSNSDLQEYLDIYNTTPKRFYTR
ncbi:MAG: hypothetical protein V7776_21070 [Halopseudomonas aestusnigri]